MKLEQVLLGWTLIPHDWCPHVKISPDEVVSASQREGLLKTKPTYTFSRTLVCRRVRNLSAPFKLHSLQYFVRTAIVG